MKRRYSIDNTPQMLWREVCKQRYAHVVRANLSHLSTRETRSKESERGGLGDCRTMAFISVEKRKEPHRPLSRTIGIRKFRRSEVAVRRRMENNRKLGCRVVEG